MASSASSLATVEQLRRALHDHPERFLEELDRIIQTCTDEPTLAFWKAVRELVLEQTKR
jgi:hypothetical protein